MPRPTKYSQAIASEICKAVEAGSTRTSAAQHVGIDYSTFRKWMVDKPEFSLAVTRAGAKCEVFYTAILKKAAGGWDAGTIKRTVKTVFKTRRTRHKDGSVVEEPVALEEVTEEMTTSREFDWRAALEWLKRRSRQDWGDSLDIRKLSDEDILRLLAYEQTGEEREP